MKKLLNTLYITSENKYLHKEGETVVVELENDEKKRFPIHNLESIICFGNTTVSTPLMEFCNARKVYISFLSEQGKYYARVEGPLTGNVLLRREQYRKADQESFCSEISRYLITAKILNSRNVLMRAIRESGEEDNGRICEMNIAANYLKMLVQKLEGIEHLNTLRGIEGDAAHAYFRVFNHLIIAQKSYFLFQERNRRPPLDNVNALLSYVYTLLVHDYCAALQCVGMDPAVGYLHVDRPGRPSLALDLMEECRAYLGDRLVLSLINRQQVKANGFEKTETGAVTMDKETRKIVIDAYQRRKREEIQHPFINEKIEIGLIPFVQAQLLARYVRGDLDAYPPFFWK